MVYIAPKDNELFIYSIIRNQALINIFKNVKPKQGKTRLGFFCLQLMVCLFVIN
jgi:hypothetical protein